ncbi:MOSC domain-containing protein [Roseovarius sp. SYSU LYC5161]|uniref:MOSC domain-containing protein n=1 Tax=Roseovarius halophilus (ex Wu et al. 2025) TaxID=3376060 RepID=UPI00399B5157
MAHLAALWRHPIKGHGREPLESVTLTAGQTMPWDRRWAVAHDAARITGDTWAPSVNFSRGAKVAALMAIEARCDESSGKVTLTHPDLAPLTFDPDHEDEAFLDWIRPVMPPERAQSARIHRVEGRGMTDTDYPSVSVINLASNADLSEKTGREVSSRRWRCNLHLDGLEPWAEFDWVGRTLRIGEAEITVHERILRCPATTANPETGQRDLDTLEALKTHFGHQDFGVYAEVTRGGRVTLGDAARLI